MSHTHTQTYTHRLSGTLYDGPGSETWDRHRDQKQGSGRTGCAAVPQVQFRHGNVILKHSRLKVDEKKKSSRWRSSTGNRQEQDESREEQRKKLASGQKEHAESNVIMGQ